MKKLFRLQKKEYGTAAELPMFLQLRSTGYRKRSKVLPPYPTKETVRSFEIPDIFRLNSSNEPFLIHDSANPDRLIVFASKTSLKYLGKYLHLFIAEQLKKMKRKENHFRI